MMTQISSIFLSSECFNCLSNSVTDDDEIMIFASDDQHRKYNLQIIL